MFHITAVIRSQPSGFSSTVTVVDSLSNGPREREHPHEVEAVIGDRADVEITEAGLGVLDVKSREHARVFDLAGDGLQVGHAVGILVAKRIMAERLEDGGPIDLNPAESSLLAMAMYSSISLGDTLLNHKYE